jgi:acyl dehydratase
MTRRIALEEFPNLIGEELGISPWFAVDQDRITAFADATSDHQWLHVDIARAERERGGTIAHGYLTLSLLAPLVAQAWEPSGLGHALNYGIDRLRFITPVLAGARIRCRETLLSASWNGAGMLLRRATTVEIEGEDRPALVAETLMLAFPETPR